MVNKNKYIGGLHMSKKEKIQNTEAKQFENPNINAQMFSTPPAGIYPKVDRTGRVIKYKRRGGVFPFFMGLFSALFVLVFCLGMVLSYVFYCMKVDDLGKNFGIDTSFLPVETNGKTAKEILDALVEYKNGYTEMTVEDAKTKLGFNLEEFVSKNIGLEINGLYEIEITVTGLNESKAQKVGNFKLQEILNNMQNFVDALLPELYKKVKFQNILDILNVDFTQFDYPILTEAMFYEINPTFNFAGNTFQIDSLNAEVLDKDGNSLSPQITIENGKFSLEDQEFTINFDHKSIFYGENESITLTYSSPAKKITELSIDQVLYSVLPNYVSGNNLTIGFIQNALGLDLIPEEADYQEILSSTISSLSLDELAQSVKVGAVLDLVKSIDLESFPFLTTDNFRNQIIKDVPNYLKTLKINEIIKNIPESIDYYANFNINDTKYFIINDSIYQIDSKTISNNQVTLNDKSFMFVNNDVYNFEYSDEILRTPKSVPITNNTFKLSGITYTLSVDTSGNGSILSENGSQLSPAVNVINGQFILGNYICQISGSEIVYGKKVAKIEDEKFYFDSFEYTLTSDRSNITYYKLVSPIVSNTFVINSTTYSIDDERTTINGTIQINSASKTTDIILYQAQNICIDDILNNELSPLVESLKGVKLLNLVDSLTGFLEPLSTISIGEILENPNIILDTLKTATLGELISANESSSVIIQKISSVTIGEIIDDSNIVLNKIKELQLADLGIDSTDKLFGDLATLTLGTIIDDNNALLSTIKAKKLKDFTNTSSGIMNIIKDISIEDLMSGNAIMDTLKTSQAPLSYLLGQEIYEYAHFDLGNGNLFYIIKNGTNIQISQKASYKITEQNFSINDTTYTIKDDKIYQDETEKATINLGKFILEGVNYKILNEYVITENYSKVCDINTDNTFIIDNVTYTLDLTNNKVTFNSGSNSVTIEEKSSSLTQAIMKLEIQDLFGNNFETKLKDSINDVEISDIITSNYLIDAIIKKSTSETPATIGNLGTLINALSLGDLTGKTSESKGIINLLSYTDGETTFVGSEIPVSKLSEAMDNFDITNVTLGKLADENMIDETIFDSLDETKKQKARETTLLAIISAYIETLKNAP